MKVLLDTHTFVWMDSAPAKLSAAAQRVLSNPANDLILSVVSVWEIAIKVQIGKMILRAPLIDIVTQQRPNGLRVLPATLDHVMAVEGLPLFHSDPFDRLLAAQAILEGADLLTADPIFAQYPVRVIW